MHDIPAGISERLPLFDFSLILRGLDGLIPVNFTYHDQCYQSYQSQIILAGSHVGQTVFARCYRIPNWESPPWDYKRDSPVQIYALFYWKRAEDDIAVLDHKRSQFTCTPPPKPLIEPIT